MTQKSPTAVSGEGRLPYEEEFRAIGHILEKDAQRIMERWFERATEEQMHASADQREAAMDELLEMLQSFGRRLHQQSGHAQEVASQLAREHGEQRFGLGWNIVDLVRDYEILHGVTLEHLGQVLGERLTYRQAMIIATVVNGASGHAVHSYIKTKERLAEQVKQQQAELRQLTLDLTEAEHRERERIAVKLHDDLQQVLVAMRMRLRTALAGDPPKRSAVEEAIGFTDQAIETSRNLTADLHPRILEHQDLPEAIEWLGGMFEQRYGLKVTVDLQVARDSNPGPLPLRRLVYDGVRELLFNVVKHAQTDQAWVKVCCEGQSPWRIEVEDRGVGSAEMAKATEPSGGGLRDEQCSLPHGEDRRHDGSEQ
jgi:signal transduction histidine kinase